jgi:hypothetical protein
MSVAWIFPNPDDQPYRRVHVSRLFARTTTRTRSRTIARTTLRRLGEATAPPSNPPILARRRSLTLGKPPAERGPLVARRGPARSPQLEARHEDAHAVTLRPDIACRDTSRLREGAVTRSGRGKFGPRRVRTRGSSAEERTPGTNRQGRRELGGLTPQRAGPAGAASGGSRVGGGPASAPRRLARSDPAPARDRDACRAWSEMKWNAVRVAPPARPGGSRTPTRWWRSERASCSSPSGARGRSAVGSGTACHRTRRPGTGAALASETAGVFHEACPARVADDSIRLDHHCAPVFRLLRSLL